MNTYRIERDGAAYTVTVTRPRGDNGHIVTGFPSSSLAVDWLVGNYGARPGEIVQA